MPDVRRLMDEYFWLFQLELEHCINVLKTYFASMLNELIFAHMPYIKIAAADTGGRNSGILTWHNSTEVRNRSDLNSEMLDFQITDHLSVREPGADRAPILHRRLRRQDAVRVGEPSGSRGKWIRTSSARAMVQMLRGIRGAQGMRVSTVNM